MKFAVLVFSLILSAACENSVPLNQRSPKTSSSAASSNNDQLPSDGSFEGDQTGQLDGEGGNGDGAQAPVTDASPELQQVATQVKQEIQKNVAPVVEEVSSGFGVDVEIDTVQMSNEVEQVILSYKTVENLEANKPQASEEVKEVVKKHVMKAAGEFAPIVEPIFDEKAAEIAEDILSKI